MKNVVIVNGKAVFDIETLFARQPVVGHQRGWGDICLPIRTESCTTVSHRLVRVFEKRRQTVLFDCLGVSVNSAPAHDVVLVDASQLLHHVGWPVAGTAGDLALSFGVRLSRYLPEAQKLVLFDRYYKDEPPVKDHERVRRAGRESKVFHLTPNTQLPCIEAMLNDSMYKLLLASILCAYTLHNNMQLVNKLVCLVTHEEADITLCSYMLEVAASSV